MASRKHKKKASQGKRPSAAADAVSESSSKNTPAASKAKASAKPVSKAATKAAAKAKKTRKPNIFARVMKYIGSIRTEMRRVTWPSKKELINYSFAVCASLVVIGIVIAALDTVIGQGLVLFSGLRG